MADLEKIVEQLSGLTVLEATTRALAGNPWLPVPVTT